MQMTRLATRMLSVALLVACLVTYSTASPVSDEEAEVEPVAELAWLDLHDLHRRQDRKNSFEALLREDSGAISTVPSVMRRLDWRYERWDVFTILIAIRVVSAETRLLNSAHLRRPAIIFTTHRRSDSAVIVEVNSLPMRGARAVALRATVLRMHGNDAPICISASHGPQTQHYISDANSVAFASISPSSGTSGITAGSCTDSTDIGHALRRPSQPHHGSIV
ncbi:hypothetical protein OBBRIDRAFT_807452 [Obba rivulosa]|uniref:Uncharacterized protein n=1 Tax=Obba rivulosa TaxID=1052685 RepID=A0A8E2AJA1_9APHY|nr:hypothetical protein OBBRIDRAFT_807452 [Obba rivulosa]